MIEIKHWSGRVLYTAENATDMRQAVEEAARRDADLRGADLSDANLFGANLFGANLFGANLYGANLRDANLSDANLSDANLSDANLSDANLSDADLSDANLSDANLFGANLFGANLSDANLSDANLRGANLSDANLSDANLSGANLRGANLSDANLSGANLRGADLFGANLHGANLSGAVLRGAVLRDTDRSLFRLDVFDVLDHAPAEVAQLREIVMEGRMDGSMYEPGPNHCGCLIGSLAVARGCTIDQLAEVGITRKASRPAERWVYPIRPGDVPSDEKDASEGAWRAARLVGWIDEWRESRERIAVALTSEARNAV